MREREQGGTPAPATEASVAADAELFCFFHIRVLSKSGEKPTSQAKRSFAIGLNLTLEEQQQDHTDVGPGATAGSVRTSREERPNRYRFVTGLAAASELSD
jgi:hypothetical protein